MKAIPVFVMGLVNFGVSLLWLYLIDLGIFHLAVIPVFLMSMGCICIFFFLKLNSKSTGKQTVRVVA